MRRPAAATENREQPLTHAADDGQEALRLPLAGGSQHLAIGVLANVGGEVHDAGAPPHRLQLHFDVPNHVRVGLRLEALLCQRNLQRRQARSIHLPGRDCSAQALCGPLYSGQACELALSRHGPARQKCHTLAVSHIAQPDGGPQNSFSYSPGRMSCVMATAHLPDVDGAHGQLPCDRLLHGGCVDLHHALQAAPCDRRLDDRLRLLHMRHGT